MAASSKDLGNLHSLFANYWEKRFEESNQVDGLPITAAELAVLRAFLKDNNVQADPDANGDVIKLQHALAGQLKDSGVKQEELDQIMADFQHQMGSLQ